MLTHAWSPGQILARNATWAYGIRRLASAHQPVPKLCLSLSSHSPTANQGGTECHHCGHPQQNRCPTHEVSAPRVHLLTLTTQRDQIKLNCIAMQNPTLLQSHSSSRSTNLTNVVLFGPILHHSFSPTEHGEGKFKKQSCTLQGLLCTAFIYFKKPVLHARCVENNGAPPGAPLPNRHLRPKGLATSPWQLGNVSELAAAAANNNGAGGRR